MHETLRHIRDRAAELAALLPRPSFYAEHADQVRHCRSMFFDHPLILRLREDVLPFLLDEYGHGVEHSKAVAIEAGAIVMIERGPNASDPNAHNRDMARTRRLILLAQLAGLLHDTRRAEGHHAAKGAELARIILHDYPLEPREKETVAFAVANHEAFAAHEESDDPDTALVAGALYDADKFRWGPDNFTTTLWEMCDYMDLNLQEIVERFPRGVEMVGQVADSFRTATGRRHGPEFIDIGLALGGQIFELLREASGVPSRA